MMTDPISDMLTRLRNALAAHKVEAVMPYSNMKYAIAKILEKEGYVAEVQKVTRDAHPALRMVLKYEDEQPRMRHIKRVSKPGLRVYAKAFELPRVTADLGIAIVSTPSGLMTNKEARARRLGGEVICEIS